MTSHILVIPCYNEEARLNVGAFQEFLLSDLEVQFLFVDDGSKDGTSDRIQEITKSDPKRVMLLQLKDNVGKAEAVRLGVLAALDYDPDSVGYWDADLATPLYAITTFCRILEDRPGIELVLGSRVRLLGRSIQRRAIRHYMSRIFAAAASSILGFPIYDTQCGAKLFRNTPRLRRIFQDPFLSPWIFDVELLERLVKSHRATSEEGNPDPAEFLIEHPLEEWRDVAGSHLRLIDCCRAGRDLMRIGWSQFADRSSQE